MTEAAYTILGRNECRRQLAVGVKGFGEFSPGSVKGYVELSSAGQLYIVDTFLVVVFGGAGSLGGTIASAFTISRARSTLEFFLSGSMAKSSCCPPSWAA